MMARKEFDLSLFEGHNYSTWSLIVLEKARLQIKSNMEFYLNKAPQFISAFKYTNKIQLFCSKLLSSIILLKPTTCHINFRVIPTLLQIKVYNELLLWNHHYIILTMLYCLKYIWIFRIMTSLMTVRSSKEL